MAVPRSSRPLALSILLAGCQLGPETFDVRTAPAADPATLRAGKTTRDPVAVEPDTGKADWVRLKTNEWLRGKLRGLRDGTLDFKSDQLGRLKIGWGGVAELYTAKDQTVLLEGRLIHTGKIRVDPDRLLFLGEPVRQVDRSRLMAIVPGVTREADRWTGDIGVGVTLRGGNTDQTDSSAHVATRRESAATRWDTRYDQNLSRIAGTETANSNRLESTFNLFLTRRLYVTVLGGTWFRDKFQNIDSRLSPRVGLGYDVIDRPGLGLEVTAGPSYQRTSFVSVPPGEDDTEETAAFVLGTKLAWKVSKDVKFDFAYDITAPLPDTEDYSHHLVGKIAVDLIGNLDLDVSFIWDRSNARTADATGVVPDADDYRTVLGFSYSF